MPKQQHQSTEVQTKTWKDKNLKNAKTLSSVATPKFASTDALSSFIFGHCAA